MNFFGHAWVAGWFSEQAPFILGSMLPDFASALRVAPPTSHHPELEAGIVLHHRTDRVFHETAAFRELEHAARASLSELGVPNGARRALAHVGVEFLIDAELELGAPAWQGYDVALRFGSSAACREELHWTDADMGEQLASLCQRLAAGSRRADSRRLACRLVATLAGRPRLALEPGDVAHVEPWLIDRRPHVIALLPSLLAELTTELGAPRASAGHAGSADAASAPCLDR
jgi:acyl carrier protein phosphodiesterase